MVLKSVGVLSVAKMLGCLFAFLGLIIGGLFSLIAVLGGAANLAGGGPQGPEAMLVGIGAIVILPIAYGLGGVLYGLIVGSLYNLVASVAGGIEVEFADDRQPRDYYERSE